MIRRSALVAAAAVALVLAPSAAMAYDAPGYNTTVSDSTPSAGATFTLRVTGVDPGAVVTLRVAGRSFTATANADGGAVFRVSIRTLGTYTAQFFVGGALVSDEVVRVVAVEEAEGGVQLATTGFDGMGFAAGAGALILVGAGTVLVVRRRQSSASD